MRGLPLFFAISLGIHALALMLGSAEGRVIDQPLALLATIRLPALPQPVPVHFAEPQSYSKPSHPVRQVARPSSGKIVTAATGQSVASGQPAAGPTGPVQESKPVDPVVLGMWESDIEDRIRQAGQRYFTGGAGRARVVMTLAASGELVDLSVTGEAADMAEKAIRSIQRWPRFTGEARQFKRVLNFVVI